MCYLPIDEYAYSEVELIFVDSHRSVEIRMGPGNLAEGLALIKRLHERTNGLSWCELPWDWGLSYKRSHDERGEKKVNEGEGERERGRDKNVTMELR